MEPTMPPSRRQAIDHGELTVHNWRDDAACLDADPDLFFPVGTAGPALLQVDQAKRICRGCPARTPCLAWALDQGISAGVWGGATEEERLALRNAGIRHRPGEQAAKGGLMPTGDEVARR